MTTPTKPRTVPHLLWQTLCLTSRHFLPLFAIGGIPWAVFSLIPLLLGQEQTFADLRFRPSPVALEQLYPFAWAALFGTLVFPLVNGALAWATTQALQGQPVRVIGAYRAALPCWGRLLACYWAYGAFVMAIGLVLTLLARWYDPSLWQGSEGLALALFGNQWTFYILILMTFYTQLLVLEGGTLRQTWTRSRQLLKGAGGRIAWVLVIFFLLGLLVIEVWLSRAGRWAEVLGSGLTNLLCMVGVTGVYWEAREREGEEAGGS